MRPIVYSFQVSLDGYLEDDQGLLPFTPDPELHRYFNDYEKQFDTHFYGRKLYEMMHPFWSNVSDTEEVAEIRDYALIWTGIEKIVFSRTLTHVDGYARLATMTIEEEVDRLRGMPGKRISVGGANLAAQFMQRDLIDEYHVVVYPVLLGGGKRMFGRLDRPLALRLVEQRHFASSGCVVLRYERTR